MNQSDVELLHSPFSSQTRVASTRDSAPHSFESFKPTNNTASPPSDSDWVSPFTLPPLPTFKRARGGSNLVTSPTHQRSNSSLYYAAAWGSPYATPSPQRTPAESLTRAHSLSELSPLGVRKQFSQPSDTAPDYTSRGADYVDALRSHPVEARTRPARDDRSERPNWLSESEGSDTGINSDGPSRTPTLAKFLKRRPKRESLENRAPLKSSHQAHESSATVTQETFGIPDLQTAGSMASETLNEMDGRYAKADGLPEKEKPLPLPPSRPSEIDTLGQSPSGTTTSYRPRMPSVPTFQRPRKKVMWKGKSCIIAVPLEDQRGLKNPLLTPADVEAKLRQWESDGFSTHAFSLSDSLHAEGPHGSGQSRPLFPEPRDVYRERQSGSFRISMPDKAQWDAYVEHIQEEKLRLLGVTPSNPEAPSSTRSPFSATISRASSHYPGLPVSPPNLTLSVGSNRVRLGSNPLSPPYHPSPGLSSQATSMVSPYLPYAKSPGAMHRYNQSVALPGMQTHVTSPQDFPYSAVSPIGHARSPTHYFVQRSTAISPFANGALHSMGEILSPVSPLPPDPVRGAQPQLFSAVEHMRQQQEALRAEVAKHQQQQMQANEAMQRSRMSTPNMISPSGFEIAHPTPRSHRHNLSHALQKEIDDAERCLEETLPADKDDEDVSEVAHVDADDEDVDRKTTTKSPPILQPKNLKQSDGKTEIETNPSVPTSPNATSDMNIFGKWKSPPRPVAQTRPEVGKGHKVQPSVSKLNVQAKPFDPQGAFASSNFHFSGTGFEPPPPANRSLSFTFKGFQSSAAPKGKRVTSTNLNADAPAFMPLGQQLAKPSTGDFKFSTATFNVDAPVFNPSTSVTSNFRSSVNSGAEDSSSTSGKIFGNIQIDPLSKATRRSAKAIPIVRPASIDSIDLEESDAEDGLDGRPQAPVERQKRARRGGSGGDRSPVFDASSPFDHRRILSEILNDAEGRRAIAKAESSKGEELVEYLSDPESPVVATSTADLDDTHEHSLRDEEDVSAVEEETLEVTTDNKASFSPRKLDEDDHTFPPRDHVEHGSEPLANEVLKHMEEIVGSEPQRDAHIARFSLSALAKPFQFQPSTAVDQRSAPVPTQQPRKSLGLEASRFAATPSPPSSPVMQSDAQKYDNEFPQKVAQMGPESESSVAHDSERAMSISDLEVSQIKQSIEKSELAEDIDVSLEPAASKDEVEPSFEEIDAVMKQFENDPDLGVERAATPETSTPLIDMRLPLNLRSDAPSPSPRKLQHARKESTEIEIQSPVRLDGLGIAVHRLTHGNERVSDWNETLSPAGEEMLESRAQFFDDRIHGLIGSILNARLDPLERALRNIQQSVTLIAAQPTIKSGGRSASTEGRDSDADDEDDYDAFEGFEAYRSRSPALRKKRRSDQIKAIVTEAMAAHVRPPSDSAAAFDVSEMNSALAEMRQLTRVMSLQNNQSDLKAVVEDVITTHPHLQGQRAQQSQDGSEEKYSLQVLELEAMLRVEKERAMHESNLQSNSELENAKLVQRLAEVEEQASQHKEALRSAQNNLATFVEEKEVYQDLERTCSELELRNAALEKTLEEYRVSSDRWRRDIHDERTENKDLKHAIHDLQDQLDERTQSRQLMRNKIDRLHREMADVVQEIASDQAEWRKKEHGLELNHASTRAILEHEIKMREKVQHAYDMLEQEHKESLKSKTSQAHTETEVSRLKDLVDGLQAESRTHQDARFDSERELQHARDGHAVEVRKATDQLQADLDRSNSELSNMRIDLVAQIARLQGRLDNAEIDLEDQKAKHDAVVAEMNAAHTQALQEGQEKREIAVQELHDAHDKKLNDMRERHTRALHNSSDDRHRLEHNLTEKLSLGEDKLRHLESKVVDLEERLEITKSAARAAVEAATARGINLPTPASSVVASPPHGPAASSLPSLPFAKGTNIPEKISPQALRESILVLQEQLQSRESTIEKLEAELAAIDKDASKRVLEQETEIGWLRELLAVRVDDIEDIITTLSSGEAFDREAAKDAAIRLRANLQMEQQLKERSAPDAIPLSLPSFATLQSFTQSPRALPMAAVAALGNWRKARDSSLGALSDLATNIAAQTPSKSTVVGSPASFLSGIMTPPSTQLRTLTPEARTSPPPTMRPLAAAAAAAASRRSASEVGPAPRPLRAYSSQPRALNSRQLEKRPVAAPSTPPSRVGSGSYSGDNGSGSSHDEDAKSLDLNNLGLGKNVDGDISPLTGKDGKY